MKSDRDQSIERLLRTLPRRDDETLPDRCPDAETLAAFADDTLVPAMRRQIEAHVADCDRCQMLTAALVRSAGGAGIPAREAARVQTWKRRVINWFVPAAAAATAVALWVIVPGQRVPRPEQAESDRQPAAAPRAPAVPEAPAGERLQTRLDALTDQSANAPAEGRGDRAVPAEVGQAALADRSRRQVVGQPALKAEEPRTAIEVQRDAPSREASAGQSARNDAERRENEASLQERVSVAAPARAAAPAPPSAAGFQARATSLEIVSPDAQARWRVGPGAVVQHSADAGTTWVAQQTGATAHLTAGSSPSADVCWLVGRGGIVLRTTDGGRRWQRAPFPETVDITAVAASSALNATVNSADGRRLQTTDGGRTWTAVQ